MTRFDLIAFDCDDTLWHTEYLYTEAQDRFKGILAEYLPTDDPAGGIEDVLYKTEMRNLQIFGYGIKGFALSLIETAVELTEGRVQGSGIQAILDIAKEMLAAEVHLLDHVSDTISALAKHNTLMLITKGDLYDQQDKITRSGLSPYFTHTEIVSNKLPETYRFILSRYNTDPSRFLMVGNSPRSDILPVLEIGGFAAYIPHSLTWAHEVADLPPADQPGYFELEHMGQLPALLARLDLPTLE